MVGKRILFVCKFNKFRSKVAEALFNKLNKNPSIKAKSAGIVSGDFLNHNTVKICKQLGVNLKGKPRGISMKLLKWQNILIIVADNIPPSIFNQKKYGKKLIVWKIHDTSEIHRKGDIKAIANNVKNIEKKIRNLVRKLK